MKKITTIGFVGVLLFSLKFSYASQMKTIDDAPKYYANLVKRLSEQPFFDGKCSRAKKSKVLHVKNMFDRTICDILSYNAQKITSKKWIIDAFGLGNHNLYRGHSAIDPGIVLKFVEGAKNSLPSEDDYKKVLKELKTGWKTEIVQKAPSMHFKKDTEGNLFFIKEKRTLHQESDLLWCLLCRFGFGSKNVMCDSIKSKKGYSSRSPHRGLDFEYENTYTIYLWVKKDAMEKFHKIFKFKFEKKK